MTHLYESALKHTWFCTSDSWWVANKSWFTFTWETTVVVDADWLRTTVMTLFETFISILNILLNWYKACHIRRKDFFKDPILPTEKTSVSPKFFTWTSFAVFSTISFVSSTTRTFVATVCVVARGFPCTLIGSLGTFVNVILAVRSGPSVSANAEWGTAAVKFASTIGWASTIVFATWVVH